MQTTRDAGPASGSLEAAQAHLDEHGYCVVEGAIGAGAAAALRERLIEQAAAEAQLGETHQLPDKKQLIYFLLNKGQGFRDLLFHPAMRSLVEHVIGRHTCCPPTTAISPYPAAPPDSTPTSGGCRPRPPPREGRYCDRDRSTATPIAATTSSARKACNPLPSHRPASAT